MFLKQTKKNQALKQGNRILIRVSVVGSAGPIRFVVNEDELVGAVTYTALKLYAREGRLPILGSDLSNFILYCPIAAGTEALGQGVSIGSVGVRDFMLCKNNNNSMEKEKPSSSSSSISGRKGVGSWRSWLHKALNLKISSH